MHVSSCHSNTRTASAAARLLPRKAGSPRGTSGAPTLSRHRLGKTEKASPRLCVCKLHNCRFTAKRFPKAKRYLENCLSKYIAHYLHVRFTATENDHRDSSILNELLHIQGQLWSPCERQTAPPIPGFSLALTQSPSLAEGTRVHETPCHAAPLTQGLTAAAASRLASSGLAQREAHFNRKVRRSAPVHVPSWPILCPPRACESPGSGARAQGEVCLRPRRNLRAGQLS